MDDLAGGIVSAAGFAEHVLNRGPKLLSKELSTGRSTQNGR
jgi:hypothetical protein